MNVADIINSLAGMPPELEVTVRVENTPYTAIDNTAGLELFVNAVEYDFPDNGTPGIIIIGGYTRSEVKVTDGWQWDGTKYQRVYRE